MKFSWVWSLVFTTVLFITCNKDNRHPGCNQIPDNHDPFGWQMAYDSLYITYPDFNPENADEFLFVQRISGSSRNSRLYLFNLKTKTLRLVFEGEIIYRPRFGKNSWILLNLSDKNIYKIKSSGEELTKLTDDGYCFYPHWNQDYSKIGYSNNIIQYGIIMDLEGNKLDTLPNRYRWDELSTWLSGDRIVTTTCDGVNIYDVAADTFFTIFKFSKAPVGCGLGIAILNDANKVIWSHSDGIYQTTIDGQSTIKLFSSCNSLVFAHASYSKLSNKILWQKVEYIADLARSSLYVKASIVMTDPEIKSMEVVEIPIPVR